MIQRPIIDDSAIHSYCSVPFACHTAEPPLAFTPIRAVGRPRPKKATVGTGADAGKIYHTATGTGPLTWSHDGTMKGIMDLNGNVSEWTGGIRTVYGELQFLANNNAADKSHAQTAASSEWKALDATTGEFVTPDGTGTTTNSVKVIVASGNRVAIGDNLKQALENLFTSEAVDINVLDLNDISGIIDTIIQENDTLTESMNNNDMEQFGRNINELRDLINQLKTAREKEKEEAKNDTTNTIVNNTVTNSIFSSYNEVVNTTR